MKNQNLMIAVAAGLAAAVVAGIVMKRTGTMNSLMDKLRGLADAVEHKFGKHNVMGMQDIIPKGEDGNVSRPDSKKHHQN